MDATLFSTVLELARIGAVGIGAIVLLLTFILLFRASTIDDQKAKLIHRFMTLGFVFGIGAGILGLVPLFFATGGPLSLRLAFSPDFDSQKLQPPIIRLPDGTKTRHDAKFFLQQSAGTQVVTIAMDPTLDQVRNLRKASATLTSTLTKVTQQRDVLAVRAAALKPTGQGPALQKLEQSSINSFAIQSDVFKSLNVGDYARAYELTGHLQGSVNAAQPAVAVIASQKDEAPQQ